MTLFDRVFGGNDAVFGLTEGAIDGAIAQYGEDKAVSFPNTAYSLPCYYAVTGTKVTTLKELKEALGVAQVKVVANKVRNEEDEEFIRSKIPAEDLLGMIHYNTEVIDADRQGKSPYDFSQTVTAEITKIKEKIDQNSNL